MENVKGIRLKMKKILIFFEIQVLIYFILQHVCAFNDAEYDNQ